MKIDTLHTSVAQLQDAGTPLAVYDSQNSAKLPDSELCEEAHFHVGETITSIQVQFNLSIVLKDCFGFCFSCTGFGEVGGWGRDPKKCTGRDWGMGSSTI